MARSAFVADEALSHVMALLMPANALAVRVSADTGLRIGDVLSLRTADLHQRMRVREQKTGKHRRVYIGNRLLADLQAQAGDIYVFPHRTDPTRHRTRQAVWYDVKRAVHALRLDDKISVHSARKSYAVHLMQKYHDLEKVRKIIGHSDTCVTFIYACADMLGSARLGSAQTKTINQPKNVK